MWAKIVYLAVALIASAILLWLIAGADDFW